MEMISGMRRMALSALLIVACCAVLSSCATKQRYIHQLENLSYDLRDNSQYYSAQDWRDASEKFVKIRRNIADKQNEYTAAERRRIGELEGDCARYMARGLKDNVNNRLNEVKGFIESIIQSVSGGGK